MKRIVVISGSEATRREIHEQLNQLLGDIVQLESYATDNGIDKQFRDSIVLLTSPLIAAQCNDHVDRSCTVIPARRSLNFACLDRLYELPEGDPVCVVNDTAETAAEVIEMLKLLGFTQHSYALYYPGATAPPENGPYIVTPGETALIPPGNYRIIDIGPRVLDISTIVEVLQALNLLAEKAYQASAKYLEKIIVLGRELHHSNRNTLASNEFLSTLFDSVGDGILSYTEEGTIRLLNPSASRILGMAVGASLFLESRDLNQKLHAFLTEDALDDYLLTIDESMYLFSKRFIPSNRTYLLTIKNIRERINLENSLKKELKRQGHIAKHSFNSLIARSECMEVLKKKAEKLAASEFSILIHGESGTGKELFASAVHNASKRKNGPYLAVNFSALPDELIESELFGYEEGAFTGARKGGKAGLFELADQGTLFLDEIGDISPKIQSRLLRVLQEKEVLKLGGTRNIPVNARIVAATNKDLFEMVRRGEFREDLYYRLKKLTLTVPPLRERKEDILPLLRHFLIQKNGAGLKLTSEATRHLEAYDWPGNVRELENTVEYMLAISDSSQGDLSILPEDLLRLKTPYLRSSRTISPGYTADQVSKFLLETVSTYNRDGRLIGRKTLSECSVERGFNLTEPQVRRLLERLSREGKIQMGKGRSGIHLAKNTDNG